MDSLTDWIIRLDWILVAWLFALGGVVGSFLNVVVYRLPAGRSIVHPGSCCPVCGHPIRWYHNLPIVSWLVLGGRCYDCRAKISPRYPLVELATAVLFVAVFAVDVRPRISALANPEPTAATPSGLDVVVRYAGDLCLICTLFCAALIELDGGRVPRRIFWTTVLAGSIVSAAFPAARQLGPIGRALEIAGIGMVAGWATGHILGIAIDALAVRSIENPSQNRLGEGDSPQFCSADSAKMGTVPGGFVKGSKQSAGERNGLVAALSLAGVGTFLGWAAAIAVGMFATVALIAARRLTKSDRPIARFGWSTFAFFAALAWILAGRLLPTSLPLTPNP
ncbi:MAG TPA: prepilin peptidase [Pirellulales bacterium]|jgi:prepilin signal peptidase PulO-like enzyme (type II secretory pathway)|nr:prepilin peptidase [Pirellulales bacterium]